MVSQNWVRLQQNGAKLDQEFGKLKQTPGKLKPESTRLGKVAERSKRMSSMLKNPSPTKERISQSLETGKEPIKKRKHWIFLLRLQTASFQQRAERMNLLEDSQGRGSLDNEIQTCDLHIRGTVACHLRRGLLNTRKRFEKNETIELDRQRHGAHIGSIEGSRKGLQTGARGRSRVRHRRRNTTRRYGGPFTKSIIVITLPH